MHLCNRFSFSGGAVIAFAATVLLSGAQPAAAAAAVHAQQRSAPRRQPAGNKRPQKSRAQQIHDFDVLYQANMRAFRNEMASSQEYSRRGDKVQADAFRMNASDSRKKAENYKRQRDAMLRSGGGRRRR